MPVLLYGQTRPSEGAKLNYRIIGFSFPDVPGNGHYTLQIALGHYNNEDSFRKSVIVTVDAKTNKAIAEVPAFGKKYTWCVVNDHHGPSVKKNALHHFSTLTAKWVDPDSVRLRIITAATAHKDDYVFLDGNKALYDMSGNPVWFLPKIEKDENAERPRDIKVTPFNTITMLISDLVYEINYDATILWRGPGSAKLNRSMDSITALHHHELTRLNNGHYMTFGFEQALFQLSEKPDSIVVATLKDKIIRKSDGKYYEKIACGKLMEYDAAGKVVWQWLSSDYFKHSDLMERKLPIGMYDIEDTHANAFYFDEKKRTICVSFRNLNRIVKISYPDGKVLNTFGRRYVPGTPHLNLVNGLFCGQHSCRASQDGDLYLFNNNICHPKLTPTIIMMRPSPVKKDSLEKVWEFECPMDELTPIEKSKVIFHAGGNVLELPDRTIFCCMGSDYGKTFIVDRDKKILWCAQPEIWKNNKWAHVSEYRGSIITRHKLEELIWGEHIRN